MAEQVLAAVKVGPKATELREVPMPDIPADAGLLKVEVAGVCGSDVGSYPGETRGPLIMGHENVGVIAKVGAIAAERWGVLEGDRVAIEEYLPCWHCEYCHAGEYRLCKTADHFFDPNNLRFGSTMLDRAPGLWGGFSQYLYLPPNTVIHRVPLGPPLEQLAMALPMGNGVQWACVEGEAGPGKTVLIVGPGQQGLCCLVAARAAGARKVVVAGLSRDEYRLGIARKLGADATIDVETEDIRQRIADLTDGRGLDSVVDTTSSRSAQVVLDGIDVLKHKGGVLVAQGIPSVPDFPMAKFTRKYITLKSARGHSYKAVEIGLGCIASGRFPLDLVTTDQFGLDAVDRAIRSTGGEVSATSIHVSVLPWK
ncbi:MAG TPA: zinc-binding dehydrogenase [Chloroflexota bacterium]|nr:zinc-binding dehydrogenase [Chloroflexota bacterium]